MTDADWSLPQIDSSFGDTPEEVMPVVGSGRSDWATWAQRDMRAWLRELRAYERRVKAAMAQTEARLAKEQSNG